MGRSGSSTWCDEKNGIIKKGPWTPEEDQKLVEYVERYGHGSWRVLPKLAGLNRCGKSCRLRWTNYLRPDIKRGNFSQEEEQTIINLHSVLGNKWSTIASNLPGRTDNEIKNFWNTHLKKQLLQMGIDPVTHTPITTTCTSSDHHQYLLMINQILSSIAPQLFASSSSFAHNLTMNNPWDVNNNNINALIKFYILQLLSGSSSSLGSYSYSSAPDHHHELYDQYLSCMNNHSPHLRVQGVGINGAPIGSAPQNPIHTGSQFSNFNIPNIIKAHHHHHHGHDQQPPPYHTPFPGSKINHNIYHNPQLAGSSSYATPKIPDYDDQLPPLVNSAAPSPESSAANPTTIGNKIGINSQNIHDMLSNHSSTSTTFEALGDIMDHDEATNQSYWKDIIDQLASSQKWPIS